AEDVTILVAREHANPVGNLFLQGFLVRAHRQQRSLWEHSRQCQSCGSSNARGSSSPARVAAMILAARSLQSCARSAENGTQKCSCSQVSTLIVLNNAGLVSLR